MLLEIISPGKTKEKYLAAGIEDYGHRLQRYVQLKITLPRTGRWSRSESDEKIRSEEGRLLLGKMQPSSLVIALDRTGRLFGSDELAKELRLWNEQGHRHVTFLIGGPLGFSPEVMERAGVVLSLSRLTFTHEMARLILLEQLYRACTINAGVNYHK